jgi:hypothetical protein
MAPRNITFFSCIKKKEEKKKEKRKKPGFDEEPQLTKLTRAWLCVRRREDSNEPVIDH